MKNAALIAKILTALAAIVGAAYIIATYGDRIVAWAKKLLAACPCKCEAEDCAEEEFAAEEEAPVEEEAPAEEAPVEETPVEEVVPVDENAPVAEEDDFEG